MLLRFKSRLIVIAKRVFMSNITFMERMKKNEAGFTFIELLMASVMSIMILGLLAQLFRTQQKDFAQQAGLNTLQANGRSATEFVARSVQSAGFNVQRGTRFLAASDHYLTAVYDANNDNVISNDEVMTYTIANVWDGTVNTDFSFVSHFDVDDDGVVQNGENPTINVQMTASATPFNLYKVIPDASGTAIERSLVARDIDSMVIRYYNRDGQLLPILSDTDDDGVGDTAVDADADGIPDSGNWTYTFPTAELNDIRKVEIDVLARSHKPNPREKTGSGSYTQGSLAAVVSGSTAYSDLYFREDFTAQMAPRNLVMSPWGSVAMLATPGSVDCPSTATVMMATLLDTNGDPISGSTINFTATGGASVTTTPASVTSDSNGEGTSVIDYDWSSPYLTTTISGSALVDDGSGNLKPIYNATPVGFSFGGQGFIDPFDGSQTQPWAPLVPAGDNFEINVEEYRSELTGPTVHVGSLNGCSAWQDYVVQTNFTQTANMADTDYFGIILRNQDQNNYYWVRIKRQSPGNPLGKRLIIGQRFVGTDTPLATDTSINVFNTVTYTLKAQIQGAEIKAKLWAPADPNDPAADEPVAWNITVTDSDYPNGQFGVEAMDNIFRFDNISVENAP